MNRPHHNAIALRFTQLLMLLVLLACAAPALAQADQAFESKTIRFTGGPYTNEEFGYRLMKPPHIEQGKKYPLIVFLHGAGERGSDNNSQLKYFGNWIARAEMREKFPCYAIAPQCRTDKQWVQVPWVDKQSTPMAEQPGVMMNVAINILLKTIEDEKQIDTSRVYLTGLSMGGYGSWELAERHPEWFAAVVPICGGGDERQAKQLVGLPLWAFHGDKDGTVPVERSRTMITSIRAAGGSPKYTELKNTDHFAWLAVYKDESGVAPWMFAQHKSKPAKFPPAPKQPEP